MNEEFDKSSHSLELMIIADMLETKLIDGDLLVKVAQVMAQPDYDEFFLALCKSDLSPESKPSQLISDCTDSLKSHERVAAL